MHMTAVRLGCKTAVIGTKWTNSRPSYRPRKCYFHLLGGSFMAGKVAWAQSSICQPRMLTIACLLMSGHG